MNIEGLKGNALVKKLDEIFEEVKSLRDKEDRRRKKLYEWFNRGTDDNTSGAINYIKSTILQSTGLLTDNQPGFIVTDIDNVNTDLADLMEKVFNNYIYPKRYIKEKTAVVTQPQQKCGTGWLETFYNNDQVDELGAVDLRVAPNSSMYPGNPRLNFYDIDKNSVFVKAEWMDVAEVKALFPEKQHLIKADKDYNPDDDANETEESFEVTRTGSPGSYSYSAPKLRGRDGEDVEVQRCRLEYYYIRDYTTEKRLVSVDEFGVSKFTYDRVYPFWRLICKVKSVILKDVAYNKPWLPFTPVIGYPRDGWLYGISDIELLWEQQKRINRRAEDLDRLLKRASRPPLIGDTNNGVDKKKISKWGRKLPLYITKRAGTELRYADPPAIPGAIFADQSNQEMQFNNLSGMPDVNRGIQPGNVTAGYAIENLTQVAQVRIRLKARMLEWALQRVGQQMVEMVADDWDSYKRIVIPEGTSKRLAEFNIPNDDGSRSNVLSDAKLSLVVKPGSLLSVSKASRVQQGAQLLQLGAIDPQAVLEMAEWPGWEKTVQRMENQRKQAMEMQLAKDRAEQQQKQAELQLRHQQMLFDMEGKRQARLDKLIVELLKADEALTEEEAVQLAMRIEELKNATLGGAGGQPMQPA